jgi:hypothetical protein
MERHLILMGLMGEPSSLDKFRRLLIESEQVKSR